MSRSRQDNPFPNQIRRYRHSRSLRLRDVADLLELSSCSPVWYWEKGLRIPSLESALKLSALLQCPVEILFLEQFTKCRHELFERKQETDKPLLH